MLDSIERGKAAPGWSRRRRGRTAGALTFAVTAAVVLSACSSSGQPSSAQPSAGVSSPATSTAGSCAWPWKVGVGSDNELVSDAAAQYWVEPLVGSQSTQIDVSGRFPDARYFSLAVYGPNGTPVSGNGVSSSLADYQIKPGAGSQNPWQHRAGSGGRYTLTIRPDVHKGQANGLPLPPGTTSQHPGYLLYRVFLPATGDFSRLSLPTLAVKQGGSTHALATCQKQDGHVTPPSRPSGTPASGSGQSPPKVAPLRFFQLPQTRSNSLLANPQTAYVFAFATRPSAADVVVMTGKAPTTAPGNHPSPWPAKGEDMRYWSMCIGAGIAKDPTVANRVAGGKTDYGCRADDQTKLNAAGDYTYVIGSETQRAAIDRVPGATFLPFSSTLPTKVYLLLFRQTLVSSSFTHSVLNLEKTDDPAAAAATMGAYYPRASVCPLATLTAHGVKACPAKS
jgi:hypothetical protein